MTKLKSAASVCDFAHMTIDRPLDKRIEAETSDLMSRSTPSSLYRNLGNELKDPTSLRDGEACERFLRSRLDFFVDDSRSDASRIASLYARLLEIRQRQNEFFRLEASLDLDSSQNESTWTSGWKQYLRDTETVYELLYEIRLEADFRKIQGVKVFINRCPNAYSFYGKDYIYDGEILLTNEGSISKNIFLRAITKSEGIIVGDQYIERNVPANSIVSVSLYADLLTDAVSTGERFPPICEVL